MVWELCQSLYGLKQAARDWYDLCSGQLKRMGFNTIPSDPCVFHNPATGVIVGLYVDDLLIAAKKLREIQDFKKDLVNASKSRIWGRSRGFSVCELLETAKTGQFTSIKQHI
jgi:hypothetical protein